MNFLAIVPKHVALLHNTGVKKTTQCGREVEIWELASSDDEILLSDWARHFRQHYCSDDELPAMIAGIGKSPVEYFNEIVFPDAKKAPGPSVRAGDFGEILVADYIEYELGYWCPRALRYSSKWNRNESIKGCDVVGFKDRRENQANDELFIFEAKAGLRPTNENRLQVAITDSTKDHLREAMTLNALKRRMLEKHEVADALRVQRFQDEADRPFCRTNGAVAVLDDAVFATTNINIVDATEQPNCNRLKLLVIRGQSLMKLVHALYDRAANEA